MFRVDKECKDAPLLLVPRAVWGARRVLPPSLRGRYCVARVLSLATRGRGQAERVRVNIVQNANIGPRSNVRIVRIVPTLA